MVVIAVVSVWTPLGWQYVADRWFTLPNFFWFLPVPLLVGIFSVLIWRLTRNPDSLQALGMDGLYPCGEGAGYAGGIVSAAVDGIRVAQQIMERYQPLDPAGE